MKKICKNCQLYKKEEGICGVNVIHEGEWLELMVKPNDECHWIKMNEELGINVKEIRFFEKNGKPHVQHPDDLFN